MSPCKSANYLCDAGESFPNAPSLSLFYWNGVMTSVSESVCVEEQTQWMHDVAFSAHSTCSINESSIYFTMCRRNLIFFSTRDPSPLYLLQHPALPLGNHSYFGMYGSGRADSAPHLVSLVLHSLAFSLLPERLVQDGFSGLSVCIPPSDSYAEAVTFNMMVFVAGNFGR